MGDMIGVPSNGSTIDGYLSVPAAGTGPGVIVIQEWWGLVDHIKDVCDRFASEGYVALAPDLYHGAAHSNQEPDDAMKSMMSLRMDVAVRDMSGAVDVLIAHEAVTGGSVGVVGFCMGGALTTALATARPEVAAAVPFYGLGTVPADDGSRSHAAFQGHFAEDDVPLAKIEAWAQRLRDAGREVELHVYPGTHHAFFNDTRPDVYDADAAALAWQRTLGFLAARLPQ